ncbi:hypothetical protein [Actinomyces sp. MRS3W]|uniref:hypothetical protein n=1 Tax=Actinomyces sp. MRS3W TaxID=2800796 RepID=UPI0028FD3F9C|nr:hypothetical protein [Actinomyces sp. MRS3W]MDU0348874.1 hypothetical protein [Actinomyces sp. MRS3W]
MTQKKDLAQQMSPQARMRSAAVRVALTGVGLSIIVLIAGALAGGAAWAGAAWGAGTGFLLTLITVVALALPWERFPLLASGGVMISFAGKIAVMIGVVLVAGAHRNAWAPGWFFFSFAAILLGVTAVEVATLASGPHAPSSRVEADGGAGAGEDSSEETNR